MNKTTTIYLLLSLTFMACNKQNFEVKRPDSLIMGDTTNMLVISYDTLIKGVDEEHFIELDLNKDNRADFRLTSELRNASLGWNDPHANLFCMNTNSCIYGKYSIDTVYIYDNAIDTYNENWSIVSTTHYIDISCYRIRKNDPVFYVQPLSYYPRYLVSSNEIFSLDAYRPDTIDLINWMEGFNFGDDAPTVKTGGPYDENGISVYYNIGYHNNCYAMPNNEVVYLGVKLNDTGGEKLGWIKLALLDGYKLFIFETAIQE